MQEGAESRIAAKPPQFIVILKYVQVSTHYIKGSVAWDFWNGFFHQTIPPGPIRGYLEPFLILATFHWVIQVLKWLPGIWDSGESRSPSVPDTEDSWLSWDTRELWIPDIQDTGESRILGVRDTRDSQIPGILDTGKLPIPGVLETGECFFYCWLFFLNLKPMLQLLKLQSIKNCVNLVFFVHIHFIHVF